MEEIYYTQTGSDYNKTESQKKRLAEIIDRLDWLEMPKHGESLSLPMMPGEGIKAMIKEFGIPKVSHMAISHDMAPYGFYGIRGHYKNADVDIFVIDEGSILVPVCNYATEKTY